MNDSERMKAQVRLNSPSRPLSLASTVVSVSGGVVTLSPSPQTLRGSGGACRTQRETEHQEQVSEPSLTLCLSQPDLRRNSRSVQYHLCPLERLTAHRCRHPWPGNLQTAPLWLPA